MVSTEQHSTDLPSPSQVDPPVDTSVPTSPDRYEPFILNTKAVKSPAPISPPYNQDPNYSHFAQQQQQSYPQNSGNNVIITQEPKMKSPMIVEPQALDPINPLGKKRNGKGERDWGHGLCDCFQTFGTCCYACWCPCMAYGESKSKLQYLQVHGRPHPNGGDSCGSWTWVYCLLNSFCLVGPCFQCLLRGDLRTRYRIKGNIVGDFCIACCCSPCELTQDIREIEDEERVLLQLNNPQNY